MSYFGKVLTPEKKKAMTMKEKLRNWIKNSNGRIKEEARSFGSWIKEREREKCVFQEDEMINTFIPEYLEFQIVELQREKSTLLDKIERMKNFFSRFLFVDLQEQINSLLEVRSKKIIDDDALGEREDEEKEENNNNSEDVDNKNGGKRKREEEPKIDREANLKKFCLPQTLSSLEENLHPLKELLAKEDKKFDGLEVRVINEVQGYGVFTKRAFKKGETVCDFRGKIISLKEASKEEQKYKEMGIKHDYTMELKWNSILSYVLNPTDPKYGYGRLLNHSRNNANVILKMKTTYNKAKRTTFSFVASKNISTEKQVLWDYDPNNRMLADRHKGKHL